MMRNPYLFANYYGALFVIKTLSRHLSLFEPLSVPYLLTYRAATKILTVSDPGDTRSHTLACGLMDVHYANTKCALY